MSRASGQCRFSDGLVMHYIYEGTGDTVMPGLFPTSALAWGAWNGEDLDDCFQQCDCEGEPVEIANDYGDGCCWKGKACRVHACVTRGPWTVADLMWDNCEDGRLPTWWEGWE